MGKHIVLVLVCCFKLGLRRVEGARVKHTAWAGSWLCAGAFVRNKSKSRSQAATWVIKWPCLDALVGLLDQPQPPVMRTHIHTEPVQHPAEPLPYVILGEFLFRKQTCWFPSVNLQTTLSRIPFPTSQPKNGLQFRGL